jgi:hypothetical protein
LEASERPVPVAECDHDVIVVRPYSLKGWACWKCCYDLDDNLKPTEFNVLVEDWVIDPRIIDQFWKDTIKNACSS